MSNKEEEKAIKKVTEIVERKIKECLSENKVEDMTSLQKVRYETFLDILNKMSSLKANL